MYPSAPNFRSADPGSAWWIVQTPDGPRVYVSQWDVIVRAFQDKARNRLLPPVYARLSSGACPGTSGGTRTWSDLWQAVAGDTNLRRTDSLAIDGLFGPATADALWALLCQTGQTERAREWNSAVATADRNGDVPIPAEFVRQVIWFALYVTRVGADPSSPDRFAATVNGSDLVLPEGAVLPAFNTVVQSAPANLLWVAGFRPGVDPLPTPPSAALARASAPAPTVVPYSVAAGLLAGVALFTWLLTPAKG